MIHTGCRAALVSVAGSPGLSQHLPCILCPANAALDGLAARLDACLRASPTEHISPRVDRIGQERIREALHLAFRKFAEFGSARQVALWLIEEGFKMPVVLHGAQGRVVEWRLPRYNTIHRIEIAAISKVEEAGDDEDHA